MGIGRIRLFSYRIDTYIIGDRHNIIDPWIDQKTHSNLNRLTFGKGPRFIRGLFYFAFWPKENQFPESSLNKASKP